VSVVLPVGAVALDSLRLNSSQLNEELFMSLVRIRLILHDLSRVQAAHHDCGHNEHWLFRPILLHCSITLTASVI
jgi:hypothetical protein